MKTRFWAAVACVAAFVSSGVQAATLSALQGDVLVNRGGGYRAVRGSTHLKPGDTVMAQPGSSAEVVYPDGCIVPVQMGAVVAIGEASPCLAQGPNFKVPSFDIPTEFLVSGAVMGGVVAGFLLLREDDSDRPVSR